ncbi:RNase adapter RapZ [Butyrivibrio sp. FCS014]|uniref:RNase adapter RapZ n=1 Tax=Butyrivibrio sp. FCS014 TaxID=1408304 RepID=UPI0004B0D06F|nr:RNase adapter RapZ [Butyrivibrio sp. FCS014]
MLEDAGFLLRWIIFPCPLIEKFTELINHARQRYNQGCLGIDARAGQSFEGVAGIIDSMKERGIPVEILFMDASDAVLIKRYKETRRIHPMNAAGDRLEDGIAKEREVLAEVKKKATIYRFLQPSYQGAQGWSWTGSSSTMKSYNSLMVNILSLGLSTVFPSDADLVFDVRFLPNPYYIEDLKPSDRQRQAGAGTTSKVFLSAENLWTSWKDLFEIPDPRYIKERQIPAGVAIGPVPVVQHRSVTIANEIYEKLKGSDGKFGLKLSHRDVKEAR